MKSDSSEEEAVKKENVEEVKDTNKNKNTPSPKEKLTILPYVKGQVTVYRLDEKNFNTIDSTQVAVSEYKETIMHHSDSKNFREINFYTLFENNFAKYNVAKNIFMIFVNEILPKI